MAAGCGVILILCSFYVVSAQITNKKPNTGVPCEWKGKNGTCVNFWKCATNAIDHVDGVHPPVCGFENGMVNSCCTACDLVANISDTFVVPYAGITILQKTGKKHYDNCLSYIQKYKYPCIQKFPLVMRGSTVAKRYDEDLKCYTIEQARLGAAVFGQNAVRDEFPHMALLGYGEDRESAQWLCGGSVISEWFILTAGHCKAAFNGFEVQLVALGILKRSDPPSLWQVYRADAFIPHPEYRPPSKYHDIALIRTDRQISFSSSVLPICLVEKEKDDWWPSSATGWGQLNHRQGFADVLQKVSLNKFNETTCSSQYGPSRTLIAGFDHTTQLCYGDAKIGMDTCAGDSGGPLQLDQCPHLLLGITSAGHPCGFPGGAGLYTRVEHYIPWIESIVWP